MLNTWGPEIDQFPMGLLSKGTNSLAIVLCRLVLWPNLQLESCTPCLCWNLSPRGHLLGHGRSTDSSNRDNLGSSKKISHLNNRYLDFSKDLTFALSLKSWEQSQKSCRVIRQVSQISKPIQMR